MKFNRICYSYIDDGCFGSRQSQRNQMREIKFRVWDKESKEMLSDVSLWNDDFTSYLNEHIEYLQDKCELMQYTGLKDKNGIEIYEGDIVVEKSYPFYGNAIEITDSNQECDELNYIGVVVYDNGYYVDLTVISNRVRGCAVGNSLHDYEHLEVLGSIYENPELLEMK